MGRKNEPQFLLERIARDRIHTNRFWREKCFDLDLLDLINVVAELDQVGGLYGATAKASPFLCLLLRLLQLQPSEEIVQVYIEQRPFKYLRALGLVWWRLTQPSVKVYEQLETYLPDYRRLRWRKEDGHFEIRTMDQLLDDLLTADRVLSIILPRITKREFLEDADDLEPRQCLVDLDEFSEGEDPDEDQDKVQDQEADEFRESLSLEETNALRLKLGLKPLSA